MDYASQLSALAWDDLPKAVRAQARRCLKDIVATAAGSLQLPSGGTAARLVAEQYGSGRVPLWFRQAASTAVGAAFANAFAVDALDCHDGFRPNKGHCGATVVPVLVGACAGRAVGGRELLTALVVGYEVACRAGLAVHRLYAPAYHASGAWASVGAAAAGARLMQVPPDEVDGVLGAAEYYSPMAPMLRCTTAPSVLKDAAAPGAWAAAMALSMHGNGMAGPPSLFAAEPAGRELMTDLGTDWMILRQYFKPWPTCRWTQPAAEGALLLRQQHGFSHDEIERVDVETFDVGADLAAFPPRHSDGAQYSTPWAVAAALVDGELGVGQVHPDRLSDPAILGLGARVRTHVAPDIQERFPEECLARVAITLTDGSRFGSPTMSARGDHTAPLSPDEIASKFDELVVPTLGRNARDELVDVLDSLDRRPASDLIELLRELRTEPER